MTQKAKEQSISPHGTRRLLYVSDPSSVSTHMLPDPVEADDLQRWIDMLAKSGVDMFQQDVYNQAFSVYWESDALEYDRRPQHQRFRPLLDAGVQPLQVLLDQCRRHDMSFFAGFRINDCHNFPSYADIVESHPEWHLEWPRGRPLDFTLEPVRDLIFGAICEVLDRFDVDGVELTFRDDLYFPLDRARSRADRMTALVRRVHERLTECSKSADRKLLLGVRLNDTFEECLEAGLDVRTWMTEGLIDYVCPSGVMQSNFNAPYEEFAALARQTGCRLYPGFHPWSSYRKCIEWGKNLPMTASNTRALAKTFYGAGADGLSVYNHFCGFLMTPPFYPQSLQPLREMRDPAKVELAERHYLFHPLPGAPKEPKLTLRRTDKRPSADFQFRLYEQADKIEEATLLLRGTIAPEDDLSIELNGSAVPHGPLGRLDVRCLDYFPNVRWFPLEPARLISGKNNLRITLVSGDSSVHEDIVIDDIEVYIEPK
jgi:hypothetical protein